MNQFLDKILNPIPAIRRKSQTQNNNQVIRNIVNIQKNNTKQGLDQFSADESQPQYQNGSYDREQVTQQMVFERQSDGYKKQIEKSGNMQNSYSLGGLRQIRHVKIMNHVQNDDQFLRSEQSQPQQSQIIAEQEIFKHQFNIDSEKYVLKPRVGSNRIVEQLIIGINSAKQSHYQFLDFFNQQRRNFKQLLSLLGVEFNNKVKQVVQKIREEICLQVQNKYRIQQQQKSKKNDNKKSNLKQESIKSVLSTQQKWQIEKKLIKQELQQRYLYRIQKLQQQLAQKRYYQQQQQQLLNQNYNNDNNKDNKNDNNNNKNNNNNQTNIKDNNKFNNQNNQNNQNIDINQMQNQHQFQIQKLNQQIQILKFQLQQKNTLITQLQLQNQQLNQHIFDIEQKIQGIQLQVQNKVRQRIKQIQTQKSSPTLTSTQQLNPILEASSHLEQSSKAFGIQSLNLNTPKIQDILSLNQILKQKLQEIQQEKALLENQLKQNEKIISFRQQQIQQNQQDINFQWTEIQKQRQSLLIRQQQLTTAEQNISKKISQIRFKQTQFDKWQSQLHTREVNLDFKDEQFNKKLQDLVKRENTFKAQREKFIKEKQAYSSFSNNNIKSRKNIQQFNAQEGINIRSMESQINQPLMSRKYYPQPDFKQQKSFQNEYQFRNRPQFMKNNLQRSYDDIDKSYTKQNRQRERFVINGNNLRTQSRLNHQFLLPQNNSRIQHQSRSKSKSNQKILLRNNFQPTSMAHKNAPFKSNTRFNEQIHQNKSQKNLDGLGSKLQRLRDQIKKQIDSIK